MPSDKPDTKSLIVEATLGLIKEVGMEGLTMRQVASAAGLSLGNLQYHFKNKALLVEHTARHYFEVCDALFDAYQDPALRSGDPAAIRPFVVSILEEAECISDACLIFREMWAVSVRAPAVETLLIDYYRALCARVAEFWAPCGAERAQHAAALLVPYLDGYSISHSALGLDRTQTAETLTHALCGVLGTAPAG